MTQTPQQIADKYLDDEYNKRHEASDSKDKSNESELVTLDGKELIVFTRDMLDSIKESKSIPEFVKTSDYLHVFTWLCKSKKDRIPVIHLAEQLSVTRATVYNYMQHDVTKQLLEYYINHQLTNRDRVPLYDGQVDTAQTNPHMARFVAEKYDGWEQKGNVHAGITINMNFISPGAKGAPVDAEVVTDEDTDQEG